MLTQIYPSDLLRRILVPRDQWRPFPTSVERPFWESLPAAISADTIRSGEKNLDCTWPCLPASRFLDYVRNGNRNQYESLSFSRRTKLTNLVLAECCEARKRFLDDIVNGIWSICEESFWGVPAHIGVQKAGPGLPDVDDPVVDLFAAETSALLAWTAYLLKEPLEAISPLILKRIENEIRFRILTPLLECDSYWWMGFAGNQVNNWNPWIVSNWLSSNLLLEKDADRRQSAVAKAMRILDNFIDRYPSDGGCDEGPGYWARAGASLYDSLEWLHSATGGQIDVYAEPLIQKIGQYLYRTQIADTYFINFADAAAIITPPPGVCFGYGKRIGDPALQSLGAWSAATLSLSTGGHETCLGRRLPELILLDEIKATDPAPPLPRDAYFDVIEVFAARDRQGSDRGFFVAAKGGHNAESHNHNDVGHVLVSIDGRPVLVDAGVEAYTAKTFSPDRYSIWTMQSAYHSLPTINGRMQTAGRDRTARNVTWNTDDAKAVFSLDIAQAYPPEADVSRWQRTVTLFRCQAVEINDDYELASVDGPTSHNLLTACAVATTAPGKLVLEARPLNQGRTSGSATLGYDDRRFDVLIEVLPIVDERLQQVWGPCLTRLVFIGKTSAVKGSWTVKIS